MPGPRLAPLETDRTAPVSADVVVVGGGVIGTSAALALAERKLDVALCEKGAIAGEQSSRNWGWVRMAGRDAREIDLMGHAIRMWADMAERVGEDVGYRRTGLLSVFSKPSDRVGAQAWLPLIEGRQHPIRIVDADAVRALLPGYLPQQTGGLLAQTDGRAEPQRAVPALARAARRAGVRLIAPGAARRLCLDASGAVAGVETELGTIATPTVVVAAGAWSRLLLRTAGLTLPQLKIVGSVARTGPVAGPPLAVSGPGFAIRPREDGGYTLATRGASVHPIVPDSFTFLRRFLPAIRAEAGTLKPRLTAEFLTEARNARRLGRAPSPFEATRTLDPAPAHRTLQGALAALKRALPAFSDAQLEERWAGAIDVTPDAIPVISTVDERPGLVIATGFSGHGFGIGPAAGRLAADLATGATPLVDPVAFRHARFFDGSPIVVEGGL